jgi:uncharacterized protein
MRPSEALAKHRDEVLDIIAKYPVSNPRVFGSVARGEDVEGSDIDILVEGQDTLSLMHLSRLEIELERALDVSVGIHTAGEFRDPARKRVQMDLKAL